MAKRAHPVMVLVTERKLADFINPPTIHGVLEASGVIAKGAHYDVIFDNIRRIGRIALFDDATKATQIDGKSFNSGNVIDSEKEYSKKIFAHKVVTPKASVIDFTGFRPWLTNITSAIKQHRTAVGPPWPRPVTALCHGRSVVNPRRCR